MAEVIIGPDIETLLLSYFTTQIPFHRAAVPVVTRVPSPRPPEFVRVLATGGAGRSDIVVDRYTVVVEAWSSTEAKASTLAHLCRGLLYAIDVVDGIPFYGVDDFSMPSNLPDGLSSHVRYTATYQVAVRGSAV